jgi:hypothetical protein
MQVGPPLTLLRLESWHRRCGRTSASTRQSIRERRRWRRWGGRCASGKKQLPRQRSSTSKPRAISSNSSAMPSIEVVETVDHVMSPSMDCGSSRELLGWGRVCGSRTEAVLLVALRVAAPAERAVRSADRANMLSVSWLGARREWINGVVDGGDRGGVGLDHFAEKLGRLSQQERLSSDWLCDHTTTASMNITLCSCRR